MRLMMRTTVLCLLVAMSIAAMAQSNSYTGYLDVFTVQVKPEKRAAFDAIAKKMADANRKDGDKWVAYDSVYGDANIVNFVSARATIGDVESAQDSFMKALAKAFGGEAGIGKAMDEFNACITSAHGEIRVRRGDLSANAPADAAALNKLVGSSRWLRTTRILVRPGKASEFEAMAKRVKAAAESNAPDDVILFSQAIAGNTGIVYYATSLQSKLGAYDSVPTLPKLLGEGYADFEKTSGDAIINTQTMIYHFLPNLSAPPTEVAAASPDFWNPKPMMAAKPKPAGTEKKGK